MLVRYTAFVAIYYMKAFWRHRTIIFDFESQFNIEEFQQAYYSHVYYYDNLLCTCKLIFLKNLLTAAANAHPCRWQHHRMIWNFVEFRKPRHDFFRISELICKYLIYPFFSSRFVFILTFSKYFKCLLFHSHDYGYFNFSSESD